RNLSSRSSFALYSTYFLIHRHCLRPRIVRRVVRHDPRPVHPGGPVNVGSFRRAIGADKTAAATPARFFVRYAQNKKNKRKYPAEGREKMFTLLGSFRPIRSSPTFGKANSIVWMIPNEWPGAWMPLGRVCSIGFAKQGKRWNAGQGVRKGIFPLHPGRGGGAPHKPSRSGS